MKILKLWEDPYHEAQQDQAAEDIYARAAKDNQDVPWAISYRGFFLACRYYLAIWPLVSFATLSMFAYFFTAELMAFGPGANLKTQLSFYGLLIVIAGLIVLIEYGKKPATAGFGNRWFLESRLPGAWLHCF